MKEKITKTFPGHMLYKDEIKYNGYYMTLTVWNDMDIMHATWEFLWGVVNFYSNWGVGTRRENNVFISIPG